MKNEEIKIKVQNIYKSIRELDVELSLIRKNCLHESVNLVNYMWAPGHVGAAHVCEYCGDVVKGATNEEIVYLNGEGI